jgi:EAL domain-containing protein (putative c-di-GMP-specific phosphodiesterase class I)
LVVTLYAAIEAENHSVARSVGLAHVVRQPDETFTGVWGGYVLRSAFQPIFAFTNGKLSPVAFEGLLRPSRGNVSVSPGTFFGLIPPIDRMHVETLSRTLHLLNAGRFLNSAAMVFVNFDPSVFFDRDLTESALRDMRLILHEAGVESERVVCEVTEQRSASESTLFNFVEALRSHGFAIAVDDFGAEDSDIHRIERLKPDIVKFDAQWIGWLMNSGPGFALLSEMVETFKQRGIRSIFEGIEHGWQLELAEKCGVSMVQGFAIAHPEVVPNIFPWPPPEMAAAPDRPEVPLASSVDTSPAHARPTRSFGKRTAPPA